MSKVVSITTLAVASGAAEQLPGRLDPVDLGHADVHQHDIRRDAARLLDRLSPVGRLADDLEVGLRLEDHPEAGAHECLVVDDQHAHRPAARPPGARGRARPDGRRGAPRPRPPACAAPGSPSGARGSRAGRCAPAGRSPSAGAARDRGSRCPRARPPRRRAATASSRRSGPARRGPRRRFGPPGGRRARRTGRRPALPRPCARRSGRADRRPPATRARPGRAAPRLQPRPPGGAGGRRRRTSRRRRRARGRPHSLQAPRSRRSWSPITAW